MLEESDSNENDIEAQPSTSGLNDGPEGGIVFTAKSTPTHGPGKFGANEFQSSFLYTLIQNPFYIYGVGMLIYSSAFARNCVRSFLCFLKTL
jgi:hypothetical protein